jgi:hypothetical protein
MVPSTRRSSARARAQPFAQVYRHPPGLARARVLLKADAAPGGPDWPEERIGEAREVGLATVARVCRRFVELGVAAALKRRKQARPSRERKLPRPAWLTAC